MLIFDEATSALDNLTQKKVTEALDSYKCTRIVIAHRLSTIQSCDRILLLRDGKIAEDGTYDELIAQGGFFAELVERQRLDTGNEQEGPENGRPGPEYDQPESEFDGPESEYDQPESEFDGPESEYDQSEGEYTASEEGTEDVPADQ